MLVGNLGQAVFCIAETNGEPARLEGERGREKAFPSLTLWKGMEESTSLYQKPSRHRCAQVRSCTR